MKQKGTRTILAPFLFCGFHPESTCATMRPTRLDEAHDDSVYNRDTFPPFSLLHNSIPSPSCHRLGTRRRKLPELRHHYHRRPTANLQFRRLLALPPTFRRPASPATDHSEKERPVHDLTSESIAAEGCPMSLADESHPYHDFPGQRSEPLQAPAPQAGTLVWFSQPIPYAEALTLQKHLQKERIAERQGDVLLLLEHSPVYTLGRTTQPAHWGCGGEVLRRTGASLQSVDRGGSITYHGPGQVVGYPILKLYIIAQDRNSMYGSWRRS